MDSFCFLLFLKERRKKTKQAIRLFISFGELRPSKIYRLDSFFRLDRFYIILFESPMSSLSPPASSSSPSSFLIKFSVCCWLPLEWKATERHKPPPSSQACRIVLIRKYEPRRRLSRRAAGSNTTRPRSGHAKWMEGVEKGKTITESNEVNGSLRFLSSATEENHIVMAAKGKSCLRAHGWPIRNLTLSVGTTRDKTSTYKKKKKLRPTVDVFLIFFLPPFAQPERETKRNKGPKSELGLACVRRSGPAPSGTHSINTGKANTFWGLQSSFFSHLFLGLHPSLELEHQEKTKVVGL